MVEPLVDSALTFREKEKTLFVSLHDTPGNETLTALRGILSRASSETRLFFDLRDLDNLNDGDVAALRKALAAALIPAGSVYFKGVLGFSVAVDGNKVLVERGRGAIPPEAEARFRKRHAGCGGHAHHCHCGGHGGCCGDGSCGRCHHDHEHDHDHQRYYDHHDGGCDQQANVAV